MEKSTRKRRLGDRKDAVLLRDINSMHFIMPLVLPNRCDNEAFISEKIDMRAVDAYVEKKNLSNPEYRYNMFQVIVTAALKSLYLRPKMNHFIANGNMYERIEKSAAFVVKKIFSDQGDEGLAYIRSEGTDTIDTIHGKIFDQVSNARGDVKDSTSEAMDIFQKMPRFVAKALVAFIRFLDRHGKVPYSIISNEIFYSSVVLSNLGSIKLHAGYHHLTNWGTCSVFVVIGEKKPRPFYGEDGSVTMIDSIDLGMTVDERIADGYYFSKTIRLIKKLLENPELLELPLEQEVEY
ncbi:MAG: 2-oxo acid dehydrogenase subunit E2 [Clostridia bacterium]|nr:2-oxo acid dehydrogenase subunit E2 [Clostridia bacterium]